ncbi:MAG: hypothetical protein DWQ37_23690 [Planctomycetota bacterium]|nr:MAG: hypothetical protein DWQ37_23690 [Planctomycetota bacterium]
MNIIQAVKDRNLFRPYLADKDESLESWYGWLSVLRCIYGLPIPKARRDFVRQITGRDPDKLPKSDASTVLLLCGRRSGKSRCGAAITAAYEAALAGHEKKLAPGEQGLVAVCSPTRSQSRIVHGYLRAIFDSSDLLREQVVDETKNGFGLRNGVRIEILTGDFRTVRGFTLLAAVIDEAAFFGVDEEAKVKSDAELVRALKPSLATTGGKLIAISSPYARKGWCYNTWQRHFGNDASNKSCLVVQAPSRLLNPLLSEETVADALAEDLAAAKSEYLAEFRDDIAAFLPREVIEACVVPGRTENLRQIGQRYHAFVDMSGGRHDDAALAIAHRKGRIVVLDLVHRYRAPFSPFEVARSMSETLRQWGLVSAVADNYAAEFSVVAFRQHRITLHRSKQSKSQLYLELLPRISSGEVELLDDETLVKQLANLERRTRSGGKDIVDHPATSGARSGARDDLSNAAAGAITLAARGVVQVGGLGCRVRGDDDDDSDASVLRARMDFFNRINGGY